MRAVHRRSGLGLLALALMAEPGLAAPTDVAPPAPATAPSPLPAEQRAKLEAWFAAVGPRRPGETFGQLVVRAGRHQLATPYALAPPRDGPEVLRIDLDTLECVSFVETSLALARCAWAERREPNCFTGEVEAWRYRGGRLGDYSSRLHYFADWILDNEARGRLRQVTAALGGQPRRLPHDIMTRSLAKFPPLRDPALRATMADIERRLSDAPWVLLPREQVRAAEAALESGDLLAIVNTLHPGSGIGHAGFVDRLDSRTPRLLHASSYRRRVLLTTQSIADYMTRRPDREAVMIARPLPPP